MKHSLHWCNVSCAVSTKMLAGRSATPPFHAAAWVLLIMLLIAPDSIMAVEPTPDTVTSSVQRNTRFYAEPPDTDELARHLFPPLTRSIVIDQPLPVERAAAMPVLFTFGTTTMTQASRPFLDAVGKMLTEEGMQAKTLVIEGHTDAVGTNKDNLRLSELRALAVKHYLVQAFDIDPLRLLPQGRGELDLVRPQQPRHGANRRVEFLPWQAQE